MIAENAINTIGLEEKMFIWKESYQFDLSNKTTIFEGEQSNDEMYDYLIIFRGTLKSFNSIIIGK